MGNTLFHALMTCDTDVEGALQRFSGNEALYITCLREFPDDPTMDELNKAIQNKQWDDAFTAAHALKGLAGNMGFIPLYHATGELVILIRKGKIDNIHTSVKHVTECYKDVISTIYQIVGRN